VKSDVDIRVLPLVPAIANGTVPKLVQLIKLVQQELGVAGSLAARRSELISFYGEMCSTNPLFVLSEAGFAERIAGDLCDSFSLESKSVFYKTRLSFSERMVQEGTQG
jgi:hypothetical protein